MPGRALLILFSIFWLWLITWTQGSAFWRDSGEFIIQARYLDISHPGGFPLYGMLSNLFSLIPIGPIAFRANAFSTAAAALFLVLTADSAAITIRLLKPGISRVGNYAAAIAPIALLLTSQSFVKQALTAEVYVLNGALLCALYRLFLQWRKTADPRWLVTIPFAAALTLGNHAASGVALLPAAAIVLFSARKEASRFLLPALISGLLGLAIYSYIPARSVTHPPMNTGNPSSFSRFWLEVSDGRDRALRNNPAQNDLAVVQGAPKLERLIGTVHGDLLKTATEISWPGVISGLLGIALLLCSAPSLGLLLCALGAGTWYFFQGWDPDPWMPLFSSAAIGCSVLLAWIGTRVWGLSVILALCLLAYGEERLRTGDTIGMADEISRYEEPASYAASMLRAIPPGAPLLAEPAWFFLKYARDIEGVGEDSVILYQPAILYPGYFSFPPLLLPSKKYQIAPPGTSAAPNLDFAGRVISALAPSGPVAVESGGLSQFLAAVSQFRSNGTVLIENGAPGSLEPGFGAAVLAPIRKSLGSTIAAIASTGGDARHFAELKAVTTAEHLALSKHPEESVALLSGLCAPVEASSCGEVALNNLGSYLNRVGKFDQARAVLEYLLDRGTSQRAAVEKNLRIAIVKGREARTKQTPDE